MPLQIHHRPYTHYAYGIIYRHNNIYYISIYYYIVRILFHCSVCKPARRRRRIHYNGHLQLHNCVYVGHIINQRRRMCLLYTVFDRISAGAQPHQIYYIVRIIRILVISTYSLGGIINFIYIYISIILLYINFSLYSRFGNDF